MSTAHIPGRSFNCALVVLIFKSAARTSALCVSARTNQQSRARPLSGGRARLDGDCGCAALPAAGARIENLSVAHIDIQSDDATECAMALAAVVMLCPSQTDFGIGFIRPGAEAPLRAINTPGLNVLGGWGYSTTIAARPCWATLTCKARPMQQYACRVLCCSSAAFVPSVVFSTMNSILCSKIVPC